MKEQVARILGNMAHEIKQCGCKDPALGLLIKQATLQVCQKFPKTVENPDGYEPKPDYLKMSHEANLGYGIPKSDVKPDRLLTDSEFLDWCGSHIVKGCQTTRMMIDEGEEIREVLKCEDCRAKAQRNLTRKECQERVDGIRQFMEDYYILLSWEFDEKYSTYSNPDNNILAVFDEWQALKEGVK